MGYLIVFVVAAAVGVGVYALTLREATFSIGGPGEPRPNAPDGTYVSVSGSTPDWQSRLTGLVGLMVAVVIGAVALAAVLYLSISAVVRIVGGLAPASGSGSPAGL